MQIFSLNWLSHKKKTKKKKYRKNWKTLVHIDMEILYITYIHIYMHCYQKLKQQFVPPKLKTNYQKKHTKTPNEKPKKTHMTWNETKSNTMPRLFCSQSPTFPHTSPTKRVHSPTKLFLYTYRTVYLTPNIKKTTLKLKLNPKPDVKPNLKTF